MEERSTYIDILHSVYEELWGLRREYEITLDGKLTPIDEDFFNLLDDFLEYTTGMHTGALEGIPREDFIEYYETVRKFVYMISERVELTSKQLFLAVSAIAQQKAPKYLTPEEAITLGGTLAGIADTALGLNAFLRSGFSIRESGNHMIIKGSRTGRANVPGAQTVLGTRYRNGSNAFNSSALSLYMTPEQLAMSSNTQIASRYVSNLGKATQLQFGITGGTVSQQLRSGAANLGKSAFGFSGKSFLGKFGTGLGYAGVAYGGFSAWQENISDGETKKSDIVSDVAVEAGTELFAMSVATGCAKMGAAIGTAIPIPVLGTAVGAIVGFGLGWLGGWAFNEFVMTDERKERASERFEECIDGVFGEEDMK